MLSIHPDAACRADVARLAAELMDARQLVRRLVKAGDQVMLADKGNSQRIDKEWQRITGEALQKGP